MPENLLLAALPREEQRRLDQYLEPVTMKLGQLIYEPDEPMKDVYFPYDFITSTIQEMSDGGAIEVGLMGVEGLVGIQVWLRQKTAPTRTIAQMAGTGLRMKADVFTREVVHKPSPLNDLCAAYAFAFLVMTSQVAACNGRHTLDKRLARWLMLIYNRARRPEFEMTHEYLSLMLGVRRPSVSTTASMLQQAGYIKYNRGKITVLNAEGLREGSCECLELMEAQFDKIFDQPWREMVKSEDEKP